jgi:thiol-disulfide isomerase/thioredoxin
LKRFRLFALIILVLAAAVLLVFPVLAEEEYAPVINKDNPGVGIDITKHVVRGKITIFDFYSDFCGPCVSVAPRLKELDKSRPDIVVKKIDINRPGKAGIDWQSPLVSQYDIKGVPFFMIYDKDGKLMASGRDAMQKVGEFLNEMNVKNAQK